MLWRCLICGLEGTSSAVVDHILAEHDQYEGDMREFIIKCEEGASTGKEEAEVDPTMAEDIVPDDISSSSSLEDGEAVSSPSGGEAESSESPHKEGVT